MFLPPKTTRIQEGPKGGRRYQSIICPPTSQKALHWKPSWLRDELSPPRKDPSHTKFSSVQLLNWTVCVRLFETPWTTAYQASLSISNTQSLLKLISIKSVMPSNLLISLIPFSFCFQSFLASGSFLMSQFFASGETKYGQAQIRWLARSNLKG